MTIWNGIDSRYLATLKTTKLLTKLHCLIELTHLGVLALAERLRDIDAELDSQKLANAKAKNHPLAAKAVD